MSSVFVAGVVEGFYGRPWSWAQRNELVDWMARWNLNTYLYAPKDELKHRMMWRDVYTAEETKCFREFIRLCDQKGVAFVYALAPGLDSDFPNQEGQAALVAKVNQLMGLGCSRFALLFDDITAAEIAGAVSVPPLLAQASVDVANRCYEFLSQRIPDATLWFCPTAYCERMTGPPARSSYLALLGEQLHPRIDIFWTGPEIVPENIPVNSITELQAVLRRPPLLWDNLHANDYDLRRLYLGPYSGRSLELRQSLRGVLVNPNCEFETNFIPLRTFALFLEAQSSWRPREAFLQALEEWRPYWNLYPTRSNGAPTFMEASDLMAFCDCFYLPFEHGPWAQELLQLHAKLQVESSPSVSEEFVAKANRMIVLFDQAGRLQDRRLFYAICRHFWELKEELQFWARFSQWRCHHPNAAEPFVSGEHRPKLYRGGLVADLQRRSCI